MPGFTPVFGGGGAIYPAQQTYIGLALTADVDLVWPLEQQVGGNLIAAAIIGVVAAAGPFAINLSSAALVSNGYAILFDNLGANTFVVKDSTGGTLLTVASGEAWVLYLQDNATAAGVWGTFQQGAGTSSANASSLAGAGLKAITTTLNQRWSVNLQPVNYALVDADRASFIAWTGGVGAFTLPDATVVGSDWFCAVKNAGSGSLTLTPGGGQTIDASATLILAVEESTFIVSDGSNWFTVGLGQAVNSVFDFISLSVAGTGTVTLAGAQLNRVSYRFTGILTGNRTVVVPASVQQYWVDNQTTGAFTLTVKTALGTGVIVGQNTRAILYCDGTNVVNADDASSIAFPITTTQGGTGLAAYAQGDLIYGSAANVLSRLAKDANATRYLSNTGPNNDPAWAQVNLADGVTGILPDANLLETGSFTGTLTGFAAGPTGTVTYTIIGNMCTLRGPVGAMTGVSNDIAMTLTGLPVACRPALTVSAFGNFALYTEGGVGYNVPFIGTIAAAGSVITLAVMEATTNGISIRNSAGWNAANSKGLQANWAFTYPLS